MATSRSTRSRSPRVCRPLDRLGDRIDALREVHPLAVALQQGVVVDLTDGGAVCIEERLQRARRRLRWVLDALAARVSEGELLICVAGDGESALVDQPVVRATEDDQV